MCIDTSGHCVFRLWCHFQGGRTTGHAPSRSKKRFAVRQTRGCDATVSRLRLPLRLVETLHIRLFRSGQSIFTRPKPIDLTLPHRTGPGGGYNLDIDLEDDEDDEDVRPLGGVRHPTVVFDSEREGLRQKQLQQQRKAAAALRPVDTGDDEDTWASLG